MECGDMKIKISVKDYLLLSGLLCFALLLPSHQILANETQTIKSDVISTSRAPVHRGTRNLTTLDRPSLNTVKPAMNARGSRAQLARNSHSINSDLTTNQAKQHRGTRNSDTFGTQLAIQ